MIPFVLLFMGCGDHDTDIGGPGSSEVVIASFPREGGKRYVIATYGAAMARVTMSDLCGTRDDALCWRMCRVSVSSGWSMAFAGVDGNPVPNALSGSPTDHLVIDMVCPTSMNNGRPLFHVYAEDGSDLGLLVGGSIR